MDCCFGTTANICHQVRNSPQEQSSQCDGRALQAEHALAGIDIQLKDEHNQHAGENAATTYGNGHGVATTHDTRQLISHFQCDMTGQEHAAEPSMPYSNQAGFTLPKPVIAAIICLSMVVGAGIACAIAIPLGQKGNNEDDHSGCMTRDAAQAVAHHGALGSPRHDGHAHDDHSHRDHAHHDDHYDDHAQNDDHAYHDGHAHHDHAHHDHGRVPFEWAGIFETSEDTYLWTAQKAHVVNGQAMYAEDTMKMVALPATFATDRILHSLEDAAQHAFSMTCLDVHVGGTITARETTCYNLNFKLDWWQSFFSIDAKEQNAIAFFTEHMPSEFEKNAHYLKDGNGNDVEPMASLPEAPAQAASASDDDDDDSYWGSAMGTAIVVNIMTLSGVIFVIPGVSKLTKDYEVEFFGMISGFAAGSLLACAFFMILFEATHLIATGWDNEVDQVWRWGTMILAGFLLPAFIDSIVSFATQQSSDGASATNKVVLDEPAQAEGEEVSSARARVVLGVLVGDFFHNFCDGLFIGAAFKGCGESFGWKVAFGSVAHEAAQEISDYGVLTGPVARLKPFVALGLNFISGLGVLFGVIVVMAGDFFRSADIGLLLAFGGGVYLHIAATECMPKIYDSRLSAIFRVFCIIMFILGSTMIGLVLLKHEHCEPQTSSGEVASDPHAGHHHH